ncbi:hypothetical protein J6590_023883 [Homalodisca vitripennis]|nr:hypothetical protein J6590_023883 [Homalodisca vitripennis]
MSSRVIGLITGHGHLRKHLHRVGILQEDPFCRMCNKLDKTVEHLLFDCPSIARERYCKCQDSVVQGGWFRAGLPFFRGDMIEINALNPTSWISTGGGSYPQPYPS